MRPILQNYRTRMRIKKLICNIKHITPNFLKEIKLTLQNVKKKNKKEKEKSSLLVSFLNYQFRWSLIDISISLLLGTFFYFFIRSQNTALGTATT